MFFFVSGARYIWICQKVSRKSWNTFRMNSRRMNKHREKYEWVSSALPAGTASESQ